MPRDLRRRVPKNHPGDKRRSRAKRTNPDLLRANQNRPKSLSKGANMSNSPRRANTSRSVQNGASTFSQLIAFGFSYLKTLKPNFKINRDVLFSRNTKILGLIIIAVLLVGIASMAVSNITPAPKVVQVTPLGNNSIGYAEKIGPYGNADSPVKIAYILGVHPREKGSHEKFEKALLNKSSNLTYCYYIYKINVTQDAEDYEQSRINGQNLAREFVVPDVVNNSYNLSVDVHYSNGAWGVKSFVFTPNEKDNVSYTLCNDLVAHFTWLSYYTTDEATSPEYVTGPMENGGVPAIVYEAYTEDDNSTTIQHAKELIEYIDNWDFETLEVKKYENNTGIFGFKFSNPTTTT